jgi:hypothetical protein
MLRGRFGSSSGEPLCALVGEAEAGTARVHVDQAGGRQLRHAGAVVVRRATVAQEAAFTTST